MSKPSRRATYRVQLEPTFGFHSLAGIADYLEGLGVSHAFLSPVLQAVPGSRHGYDVVDHREVSRDLGGADGHARMCQALAAQGLAQLLDIVPNHMAIDEHNHAWWDVLENGQSSRFSAYFDVDWSSAEERLRDKVLLPILGNHFGRVLEAGEIRVLRDGAAFVVAYFNHRVPVAPRSLGELLGAAAHRSGSDELAYIAEAFERLPLPSIMDTESRERRHRDRGVLVELLRRLLARDSAVAEAVDAAVAELNNDDDALDDFLGRQNFRLAYWRAGSQDLGYRRFFDVDGLVALKMEDPAVFRESHRLVLGWLTEGLIDGLRIDHPDGLRDPEAYFERLREVRPDAWVVAEKILEPGERLRRSWRVEGTTGYDFLNVALRVLVNPESEPAFTELYQGFTGDKTAYEEHVLAAKELVTRDLLGSDLNRLTTLFLGACEGRRRFRDFTRHDVQEVLRETLLHFPVYRSYCRPQPTTLDNVDLLWIAEAIGRGRDRRPDLDPELFGFLESILTLRVRGELEGEIVGRFQQLSAPVMAKGVEDTVFYRYLRFAVLNEVGGTPDRFGAPLDDFHAFAARIGRDWPETLLATSTHDTKRSEDVRARLAVLADAPDTWVRAVETWSARLRAIGAPSEVRSMEYLFYQTLVGAYPIERARVEAYLRKAMREAKVETSWTRVNDAYEELVLDLVARALRDAEFLASVESFLPPIVAAGRINSLAQTLLKLTAPGVPDIYQGSEVWDLSLVDPDNRRPVNYAERRRLLAEVLVASPEAALAGMDRGLPKLFVLRRALLLRKQCPELLSGDASYEPLLADGEHAGHVLAFVRAEQVITVVPRFGLARRGAELDASLTLPSGTWIDAFTGAEHAAGRRPVSRLLERFPVALLVRDGGGA